MGESGVANCTRVLREEPGWPSEEGGREEPEGTHKTFLPVLLAHPAVVPTLGSTSPHYI